MIFKKIANTDFSQGPKTPAKTIGMGILVLVSLIYLINPTGLSLDTAFDNIPFLGNLDEFGATMILLNSLKYFGLDVMKIFTGDKKSDKGIVTEKSPDQPTYRPPEN